MHAESAHINLDRFGNFQRQALHRHRPDQRLQDATVGDAAVTLGQRLGHQDQAFVQRLVATLRSAVTTADYADALAAETEAQRWSASCPAFRDGVARVGGATEF